MMIIRQLSVFLENKPGRLCAAIDVLAKEGIDISALTVADTAEFGVLRMIVDQPDLAKEVLNANGIVVRISHVLAVAMDDAPGGAGDILHLISGAGVNVEYMYACVGRLSGKALMVIRTDNLEKTTEVLRQNGYGDMNPAEIYRL
ncbi:MAG: acetolactate synthase [Clostridia bacterium]|nr:acetolactate synthase [Clostridia bacterium]